MIIYNRDGSVLLDIAVDDSSVRYRSIMQENSVTLNYSLEEHVEVPIFSYIKHRGETYTLWRPENFTKESCRNFKYTVVFGGDQEVLKNYKYKFFINSPKALNFTEAPELKFPITAEPSKLLDLLVDNLNLYENDPIKKWKKGDCLEAKPKLFSVNHDYCWDILQRIASEFETEWEIENRTIHLRKVEKYKDNPLKLSYGKGNGFLQGVGRQNRGDKSPVTILYVQGGNRNIVYEGKKGTSKTLLLPKEQELSHGKGADVRRYKTDKHGTYIVRADKEMKSYNEDSYDGSHFYPSYVGKITEVIALDATEEEKEKHKDEKFKYVYDFKDGEIKDSLNFEDYLIKGEDMTIIFQTGKLTGREFKVKYIHEDKNKNKERRFKILPERMDGVILPCENLSPMVGDEYAVFHINLPPDYVCNDTHQTGASWDMYREAVKYFYENEHEQFSFSGKLDPIWAKKKWSEIGAKILPGGYVEFSDTHFQPEGILIRITGVTDYINSPYTPDIDLSNAPVAGSIGAELGKIEAEEVVNEQRHNDSVKLTERRFRDAQETGKMLIQAALEGFGDAINPILVNTMQLLVGSEQLQFRFIDQYNRETTPYSEMDDTAKVLKFISSNQTLYLQHMTLGITEVSPTHNNYKYWRIPSYVSHYLGDNNGPYFFYAKCSKNGGNGNMASYVLSPDPIRMDGTMVSGNKGLEDTSCYHFLIGTLGSEREGKRSFETLYGFTEVLPGRITTGMIKSSDGNTYFNLKDGVIGGRIVFGEGSTGYNNLKDKPNINKIEQDINDLGLTVDSKNKVFYSDNTPRASAIGDLWIDGVNIYEWNGLSWVFKKLYDVVTTINKGLITTGAIAFKGLDQTITGGMAGSGPIRIWSGGTAGKNGEPPTNPTFSVDSKGVVIANSEFKLHNNKAGISGYGTSDNSVRIWAGNANAEEASFRVTQGGTLYAKSGEFGAFKINSEQGFSWNNWKADETGAIHILHVGPQKSQTSTAVKTTIYSHSIKPSNSCCVAGVIEQGSGVAIYGSTDGWGSNYPTGQRYAGFFSGHTKTTGEVRAGKIVGAGFKYVDEYHYYNNEPYTQSYTGISFNSNQDLDDMRLCVRGGLIVGLINEDGDKIIAGVNNRDYRYEYK